MKEVTRALLMKWPLPQPDDAGDKEDRGRILVVGGSPTMPGAVLLAAVGALRVGAGKLQVATVGSAGSLVAAQIPEARVVGLPETKEGGIAASAAEQLIDLANRVTCVVFGPGMEDEESAASLLAAVLPKLDKPVVVLDAASLAVAKGKPDSVSGLGGRAILTPHTGEMASLTGQEKERIEADKAAAATAGAVRFGCVLALKGAETLVANPAGDLYINRTGNVGLATSGSGDTLAGIVGGLAARGADPIQAAVWGVFLHGSAGDRLARRVGPLGFLARELLDEIPPQMASLAPPKESRKPRRGPRS